MVRVSKKIHIDRLDCLIGWVFLIGMITPGNSSSKKSLNNCHIVMGLANDDSPLAGDFIANLTNQANPKIDINKMDNPVLREKNRIRRDKVYCLPFVVGLLLSIAENIKFERLFS